MGTQLFSQYSAAIRAFSGDPAAQVLRMTGHGNISVHYAPFDWVNSQAKIVLVGITPGRTQAVNALREAQQRLAQGAAGADALMHAKKAGAFSGAMRPNLVAMLNHIGLAQWLKLGSCDALFGSSSSLLQTTSVLPFPVFVDGENYNGTPDIVKTPVLRSLMTEHFVPVVKALPAAVFVPLGPVPTKAMAWLVDRGHIAAGRVLSDMPHPSTANSERIAYFLGQKDRSKLSSKTNPDKLDLARASLMQGVATLPSLAGSGLTPAHSRASLKSTY
jgi:hypothetical protein